MSNYCNHCMSPIEVTDAPCPVCGRTNNVNVPAHHLLPGTILNGKFYVGEVLGEGGFGITYIGRDTKLDMKVAIKEFYPNGYVNRSNTVSPQVNDSVTEGRRDFFEKGRERFLQEARILARFSGEPGVVDVRDFFEENNTAYIIMEYLDGVELKTYLKRNGTLTPEHTIQLLMPVMNSLKKVHDQGLIHRDISPDNIMIVKDKVKLLDFGAARTVSAAENKSLSVMLKPGYAPEEQYRSKGNQGPWTDVYALCATMYKCITGVTPDDATQRVFSDEVKSPSALNFIIKPEIEKAIMTGLSVRQVDRYQSVDDLIRGLQGIDLALADMDKTVAAVGKAVEDDEEATVYVDPQVDNPVVRKPEPVKETPKQETATKKKSKALLYVVLAVLLIPIVAFVIYLVWPDASSNQSEKITMSDNLFDFTFRLDGVVYQLPCEYEDLTKNGWSISDTEYTSNSLVEADGYTDYTMSKNGHEIFVCSYNLTDEAKSIKDCKVGAIGVEVETESVYTIDLDLGFNIAKGISVWDNKENIINAFGEPTNQTTEENYESLMYFKDSVWENGVVFCCYEGFTSIIMTHFEKESVITNTERPAYLNEYKKPGSMGSDLSSSVVKIEGDLYQLPAPVDAFVSNGWNVEELQQIEANETGVIHLARNGKSLMLSVKNYDNKTVTSDNCAVYMIIYDKQYINADIDIKIGSKSEPLTVGVDELDLLLMMDKLYFTNSNKNQKTEYTYSEYDKREFFLSITVDDETQEVSEFTISCDTWDY